MPAHKTIPGPTSVISVKVPLAWVSLLKENAHAHRKTTPEQHRAILAKALGIKKPV